MTRISPSNDLITKFEAAVEKIQFGEATLTLHIKNGKVHLSRIATSVTQLYETAGDKVERRHD